MEDNGLAELDTDNVEDDGLVALDKKLQLSLPVEELNLKTGTDSSKHWERN